MIVETRTIYEKCIVLHDALHNEVMMRCNKNGHTGNMNGKSMMGKHLRDMMEV